AMEYFGTLKINAAKRIVREGNHNFTEIAVLLGYNSIHYFSRHFKKVTGMTPSEYASSVKVLTTHTKHTS
ncbi:MAG: helix-turn-helix transcriptional regulator, partial [Ruthenibacterium sp.]